MTELLETSLLNIERSIEAIVDRGGLPPAEIEALGQAYGRVLWVRRQRAAERREDDDAEILP